MTSDLFGYDRSPLLIGLWSPSMGSGKTEVANYLSSYEDMRRLRFAGALKEMARAMFTQAGFDPVVADRMVDGDLKDEVCSLFGVTPRYILQTLGTEWGRSLIHPNVWLNIGMTRIKSLLEDGYSVVVDDVRFPNEAKAIEEAGGFMVKVERPDAEITENHPSEGALADWGFAATIYNESTLDDLYKSAAYLSSTLRQML